MESSPRTPRTVATEKGEVSSQKGPKGYDGEAGCPTECLDGGSYKPWGVEGAVNGSAAGTTQYNPAKSLKGG